MEMKPLKLGKDMKVTEDGVNGLPVIHILRGKYQGLKYELLTSGLGKYSNAEEHTFNIDFKPLSFWDSVKGEKKVKITEEDKYFICWAAFCYVAQKQQELAED